MKLVKKYFLSMQVWLNAKHYQCDKFSGKGYDNQTIQVFLGDKDVKTTMMYIHALNRGGKGVKSPVDDL